MKLTTNMLALKNHIVNEFEQSFTQLITESSDFNSETCSAQLISGVTQCIDQATKEAARHGLQSFIQSFEDHQETRPKTLGVNGSQYRFNKTSTNTFLTLFGPINIERAIYYPVQNDGKTAAYVPLDAAWAMSGRTVTPEVVEPILYASASMENREISQLLDMLKRFSLSTSAIYKIRLDHGLRIDQMVRSEEGLQARLEHLEVPDQTEAFVVGMDGANLPLREPGPKRGRPQERPKSNKNSSKSMRKQGAAPEPTSKESCYKNAMVGSFSLYASNSVIDIATGKETTVATRLNSIYTAQMPQERFPDFKKEFESTMHVIEQRLLPGVKKILLLDGGRPLWGYLSDRAERFKDYEKLLDYFHVGEHLSKASEAIFGKKSAAGITWYSKWCSQLKNEVNGVQRLIRSLRYYSRKTKLSQVSQKELDQQVGYFTRNAQWMNYADFVARNLPIGSGPTEAACKTIVKERMCRSGMRWDRQKGKAVLTLRTITKSGQWDQVWKSYYDQCWNNAA